MSTHYNKDVNGWIILDKDKDVSSNQVLRKIQYLLHAKKAGHLGTLDPFATGVLPMAFGEATKLIPYLENGHKTYEFTLQFGAFTSTDDTEGDIVQTSDYIPTKQEVENILPKFTGEITQIPPKFSAIHINGKRAYDLARQGEDFTIPSRKINIFKLTLLSYDANLKQISVRVNCSKGTYIRTLGRDIAEQLGACGHLISLRRIKNGFFDLSHTILLDNLKDMLYNNSEETMILPVETFLCDITVLALTKEESLRLKSGQALDRQGLEPISGVCAGCYNNKLIALMEQKDSNLCPIRVFNL